MSLRIKEKLFNSTVKALSRSMDLKVMTHVARLFEPNYDLHRRMHIPPQQAIPNNDGARQIVRDMRDAGHFPHFISKIIHLNEHGFHGKKYTIPHLKAILNQLEEEGLFYQSKTGEFIENPSVKRSKNWGVIREGDSHAFTLLKLDFVQNSRTLKKNPSEHVKKCYALLREEFQQIMEYHQGRIWLWEGDGGLMSFYYQGRERAAVSTAMEILHRLFLFNHFRSPLQEKLAIRIALTNRQMEFRSNKNDLRHMDAFKEIDLQESENTKSNGITLTKGLHSHLDTQLASRFTLQDRSGKEALYSYALSWEDQ